MPDGAERDGELLFLEHPRWADGNRLAIPVPPDLAPPWEPAWVDLGYGFTVNWCDEYPARWPLDAR